MLKDRVAGGVFRESGRELTLRTQVEWASRKVNDWFRRAAERAWGKVGRPGKVAGAGRVAESSQEWSEVRTVYADLELALAGCECLVSVRKNTSCHVHALYLLVAAVIR